MTRRQYVVDASSRQKAFEIWDADPYKEDKRLVMADIYEDEEELISIVEVLQSTLQT